MLSIFSIAIYPSSVNAVLPEIRTFRKGGLFLFVFLPGGRLQRFHNPKFPEQYIEMIDDVLKQKEELFAFMQNAEC